MCRSHAKEMASDRAARGCRAHITDAKREERPELMWIPHPTFATLREEHLSYPLLELRNNVAFMGDSGRYAQRFRCLGVWPAFASAQSQILKSTIPSVCAMASPHQAQNLA